MVHIAFQQIGGSRKIVALGDDATVASVYAAAYDILGGSHHPVKLVFKGSTLLMDKPTQQLSLKDGDLLLIVPQRKAPSERIVAAVTTARGGSASTSGNGGGDDDDDDHFILPASAAAWESAVVAFLHDRAQCPDYLLEWVCYIRPWRLAVGLAYLVVWFMLAKLSLGPVFMLMTIVVTIFWNLGTRRPGEASAYSIFNNGVRLPGQLDADEIDRQVREGQGLVR